jgi:CDP-glycerol glycerophosphotransferase (TagB/SpsB family)
LIEILRKLIHLIHRLSPRRNHAVIWGWPDYEDNVIAVEQALQATAVEKVVLLMTDARASAPFALGPKTILVKKNTLAGFLWFLTARYVFFTHPCFARTFPADVVSVNIWHGMPIKKIGWMLKGNRGIHTSHCLATSPFWAEIMQRAMNPNGAVIDTGLPRNDRLFLDPESTLHQLGIPDHHKLVTWLPTYRRSVRGEFRSDGTEYGNIFEMPDIEPAALNEYLRVNKIILIVKPHPMAVIPSLKSHSHLWIIDKPWLHAKSLTLYQILGASDALISDISSVVIDYLLLNRPIIHAFPDIDAYRNSRGFSVEPIKYYFMGPVATNSQELTQAIDAVMNGEDPQAEKRRHMRDLSHAHQDANASQRLIEAIGFTGRNEGE